VRPHGEVAAVLARRDGVHHRVLDERLQGEGRDEAVHDRGVPLQADAQAVAHPQPLDLEIHRHEGPLLAQGHLVDGLPVEPQSVVEEPAQALQGVLRERRLPAHEAEERVQRVEEEVRVELRPQGGQLRPRAQGVGDGGARRLLAHAGGVPGGIGRAHEREVDERADDRLPGRDDGAETGEARPVVTSRSRLTRATHPVVAATA
jgi:hypothetical protein